MVDIDSLQLPIRRRLGSKARLDIRGLTIFSTGIEIMSSRLGSGMRTTIRRQWP